MILAGGESDYSLCFRFFSKRYLGLLASRDYFLGNYCLHEDMKANFTEAVSKREFLFLFNVSE